MSETTRRKFLDKPWSVADATELYGLAGWGKEYFTVTAKGHLACHPHRNGEHEIDLHEVVEGLAERGVQTPVLLRFDDLLEHRIRELRTAFEEARTEVGYTGSYTCVYPIKVNQQRHLCEQIRDLASELKFGLEAGSKPELLAVLGLTAGRNEMPIVCNGFKDEEFLETVVLATKLGRNILTVVEKSSELARVVAHSERYDVRPRIGFRAKLSSRGTGRWEGSGGLRSKFGLTVSEILEGVEFLREKGMLDCLNMIHCHLGSQISDIRHFKNAVTELGVIYAELHRLGAGVDTIDLGGGLGVDYDGSRSSYASSVNYSIHEYAIDVLHRLKNVCDDAKIPHPNVVTESGRYLTAYSSALIVNVLGRTRFDLEPELARIKASVAELPDEDRPQPVLDLIGAHEEISDRNLVQVYHDAMQAREEAMSLFALGYMTLPMRAASERLFWAIGRELVLRSRRRKEPIAELGDLPEQLSDIYFCNFSVFQSCPDSWAISQLFPICPIHRLDEAPTRDAVLADITCDSDGKIDHFVDQRDEKRTIELHDLVEDEPYYLGIFLVGAYQEVLGDLHNLFGDTHVVHVKIGGDGQWEIDEIIEGDTVREVLEYVQYDPEDLQRQMRRDIEAAVKRGSLKVADSRKLLTFYGQGLRGYTYLE